jgi:hypothetical protein
MRFGRHLGGWSGSGERFIAGIGYLEGRRVEVVEYVCIWSSCL